MQLMKIIKAAFKTKNLALLGGVVIVSGITRFVPFMLIGVAGYIFFVYQTLNDSAFIKELENDEKIKNIQKLNLQCNILHNNIRSSIDGKMVKNVDEIIQDKDKIIDLFIKDTDNYIKHKVVGQAIELVMGYIRMMAEYSQTIRKVASFDAHEIVNRISINEQKLNNLKDLQAIEVIKHAIEMDRGILKNIQQEKNELDRIGARLIYIESTIKSFKQQAISSGITDETVSQIENIINESTALDSALNSDEKDRLNIL